MAVATLLRALFDFLVASDAVGVQCFLVEPFDFFRLFQFLVGFGKFTGFLVAFNTALDIITIFEFQWFTGIIVVTFAADDFIIDVVLFMRKSHNFLFVLFIRSIVHRDHIRC